MKLICMTTLFLVVLVGFRLANADHGQKGDEICSLRPDPGHCKGLCPRYYFDAKRRECRPFSYGCCGGNANNFETKHLCELVCLPTDCPLVNCFVGACTIQECPNYPDAICRAVCPCISVWLYNGEDVTDRCNDDVTA